MDAGDLRENWRIVLLVLILVGSLGTLFVPSLTLGDTGDADPTTLKYGIQLSGGTQVRAPLMGVTAEGVGFGNETPDDVESAVAERLENASSTDVVARLQSTSSGTVEVRSDNVTTEQLEAALEDAGYEYGSVREGVTEETRQQTVDVLRNKINEAGLSGGTVQIITNSFGEHLVLIEVPNENREEVISLIESRGTVNINVYYSTEQNGSTVYETREGVLTQGDFQYIGPAEPAQGDQPPYVPVVVNGEKAEQLQSTLVETGVADGAGPGADRAGTICRYETRPQNTEPCLLLVVDGEVVNAFGMDGGLANSMRSGEWAQDPRFRLTTQDYSEAREVAINLRAGELPTRLDLYGDDGGDTLFISPTQGENFKSASLITGLIAVLAVSIVVFLRYGRFEVAAPMVVTALSEVVILLGFAAFVRYPLDLSVIAGFIAVIGTGVDDLIIIGDEVMSQGDVNSRRVFQSRFRKAFWVIGAAAATTIIAMSPLAVLSLGDLQGFAIFTILGVIVGVLLTRPAYGDILRALLTDR
jgi:preprotein translocase subunit SecD